MCSLLPFGHVQVRKMIDLKGKKPAWRDCTNSLHAVLTTFLSLQAHAEGPSSCACRWIARSAEMCSCCLHLGALVHNLRYRFRLVASIRLLSLDGSGRMVGLMASFVLLLAVGLHVEIFRAQAPSTHS